jgi:hypothetical protein
MLQTVVILFAEIPEQSEQLPFQAFPISTEVQSRGAR